MTKCKECLYGGEPAGGECKTEIDCETGKCLEFTPKQEQEEKEHPKCTALGKVCLCPECPAMFYHRSSLKEHIKLWHPKKQPKHELDVDAIEWEVEKGNLGVKHIQEHMNEFMQSRKRFVQKLKDGGFMKG